jgi:rhamnose utilization protein RhaD (predicted bifunctional aldolase and dehydrogenase)
MREFSELKALSARIGADQLLVQAAGGNTSIKDGDVMWIKASGTWLKDAETREIFVPLNLPNLSEALLRDDPECESCLGFIRTDLNASQLRPSIETSVHALMPHRVVLHVHCVSTIAWAIRKDAQTQIAERLKDFRWSWIPYARPGLHLSRAIRTNMLPETDVLILGNHGLVVAAHTVASCENLLQRVTEALRLEPRTIAASALAHIEVPPGYHLPVASACHMVALDPLASTRGVTGVYYPDHVVFLGTSIPSESTSNAVALALPGQGVLIRDGAKPSVEPMVQCLADVFRRVPADAILRPLTAEETDHLLNWDAEKYRQNMRT